MAVECRFSIKKKISVLLLGVLVLALLSFTLLTMLEFKTDKLQYIHDVNKAFTSAISGKIESDFEEVVRDIQNILFVIQSGVVNDTKAELLKKIFTNNQYFVGFFIFEVGNEIQRVYGLQNKNFLALYKINDSKLLTINRQSIMSYQNRGTSVSSLFFLSQNEYDLITFVYPIESTNKIAIFNVSKEMLHRAVAESTVHESFVVDHAGRIIAHNKVNMIGTILEHHPLYEFAVQTPLKEGGKLFTLEARGQKFIGNFSKLGYGLTLISQVDTQKAFRGMDTIVINCVLFAIIILALTLIVGMYFSQTLTAPIQQLMHVTDYISAGNYDVKVDIKTQDEVAQLAEHFVHLGRRLSQREAELEVATDLATKDGLTGLYNHRYFQNQLARHFKLAQRHNLPLTLVLIDIDNFKKINDTYGHQQGDKILKELASIILSTVRNSDIAARYGGEEFVAILPSTNKDGGVIIAERIRQNFRNHKVRLLKGTGTLQATISIGVATFTADNYREIDDLIKASDVNLYEAKKTKDRVFAS